MPPIEDTVPTNGQPNAAQPGAAAPGATNPPTDGQPQGGQPAGEPSGQPGAAANPDNTNTAAQPDDGTQQQPDGTKPAGEGEPGERDEQGRYKSKIQKRIDELTHARHQAEREAARWRAIAEKAQAPAAPSRGDFATDDDYQAAVHRHSIEAAARGIAADNAKQAADEYQQDAQRAVAETYNQRVEAVTARIPDFAEVVGKANIQITEAMRDALMESAHGPEIVYQLAKNPAEAQRLAGLNVRQLDREIGRMEAEYTAKGASTSAPAPAPAARTTTAPAPVKPGVPAAAAPANTDPSKMSMEEYTAWRRQQGSKYI